jgi:hypothetical protein
VNQFPNKNEVGGRPKSNSAPVASAIVVLIVIGGIVWYQQGQQAKAAQAAQRVVDYNACVAKGDAQFPSMGWAMEFAPSALESVRSGCRITTYGQ